MHKTAVLVRIPMKAMAPRPVGLQYNDRGETMRVETLLLALWRVKGNFADPGRLGSWCARANSPAVLLQVPSRTGAPRASPRLTPSPPYVLGYPTVWARMIFWVERNPIFWARAGRSMEARTTVAKPSEAQYR